MAIYNCNRFAQRIILEKNLGREFGVQVIDLKTTDLTRIVSVLS